MERFARQAGIEAQGAAAKHEHLEYAASNGDVLEEVNKLVLITQVDAPLVELHLSNIHARDELHRHSIMSGVVDSVICGMGADGYPLAIRAIDDLLRRQTAVA